MKRYISLSVVSLFLLLTSTFANAQCAMCVATVESNVSSGDSLVGAGLNAGILYLMGVPYLIFAVIGYSWYRSSRRDAKRKVRWT
ncbi:hypothetical protein SAMN05421823_102629 [Catalinimonas alkaloidigena]|uniref:Uncharacterized protein n=1 Tax=Catalinimonas alkaloidigena TaxID=1075417 RepID=A0A1G9BJ06_9BACT|nr:hypothetical protein [Catalinimonas alkaloidigena]SDK39433.1 hypothetical protein SAMN05421823_102629 [Catalinimonas alkaloidigena]